MKVEYLTIPEIQRLRSEEAIKALHNFIEELEKKESKEFTDKQTAALNKFAKALISSIQAETCSDALATQKPKS